MSVRSYLLLAAAAIVAGLVAMFLAYALVFGGADMGEFRENCDSLRGVIIESADGIVCKYNNGEVINYE